MNDRFKFRVWNKQQNRFHLSFNCDISANGTLILSQGIRGKEYIIDDDNFVIQQCTGLKDKNGKLIYEGDILQENWHKYILEWANGAYVIKDIKRGTSYMFTSGMCIHKSEVIGNIYENEDLLKCENQ